MNAVAAGWICDFSISNARFLVSGADFRCLTSDVGARSELLDVLTYSLS